MPISRDPNLYRLRRGLLPASGSSPKFSADQLRVHQYPVENSQCAAKISDGQDQSPDRAKLVDWPQNNNGG